MFPTPGNEIYYNGDGEVLGWSKPATTEDYYCDECGFSHVNDCYEEDEKWRLGS